MESTYTMRRAVRALGRLRSYAVYPVRFLPEGDLKQQARVWFLRSTNSLPTFLAVNTGDTVIQVGTPSPRTLQILSRAVGANGRVLVVEADRENASRLESAAGSLRWRNTRVVNKGAWSARTTLKLSKSPLPSDHKIAVPGITIDNDLRPENSQYLEEEIAVDTLDNIIAEEELGGVDFLCITVNGAELEVLRGAERILESSRPRVFAKAHARDDQGVPLNKPISVFLRSRGFETCITKGEPAVGDDPAWRTRDGDVYAYGRR